MKFNFSIGGYFGGHIELTLKKGHLLCFIADHPLKPEEPTHTFSIKDDADWESLVQFLQTLQLKEVYDNGSLDGTQWSLEFKHKDIKLKSYGSNVYPPEFKRFLRLLNNITKKHGIVTEAV